MREDRIYYDCKEFPLHKPNVDANGISDFVVVFTKDGQMDIAVYNANKNLWYSVADPTGFGTVTHWSNFDFPSKDFYFDKELEKIWMGEGEYMK